MLAFLPTGWIQAALPDSIAPVEPLGLWSPALGTVLLILSLLAGAAIYWVSTRSWEEEAEVFVGGEAMDEESRVPGTQFYGPFRGLGPLKAMVSRAERGAFDLYEQTRRQGSAFVQAFRRLHTGVLTTYLYWIALGVVILLFAMIGG